MDKGVITITVDKNTTQEEIKYIRQNFKDNGLDKEHKLNIIISGQDDPKLTLSSFLTTRLNK